MIRVTVKDDDVRVVVPQGAPVAVDTGTVWKPYQHYDGPVIVTPTEEDQTLETQGKVMADDVSVLPIPEAYRDMSGPLAWMGPDAEYMGQIYEHTYPLDQTTYPSWTPSTSAKAIKATTTAGTFQADMENHEYLLRWRVEIDVALKEGATKKVQVERYCASFWQSIHRRPYGFDKIEAEDYNYNYCTNLITSSSYLSYYNSSGARTWTTGISYGIYAAPTAAAFSSTGADNPTVTIKTPTINARCSTTYFATARAAEVDQANTTIHIRGDLYRTRHGSSVVRNTYGDAIRVFNDGINAD